jgi:hypothetical protein
VDVRAGVHVVEHVPADVVGSFVDQEIIAAVPAPVRTNRPIPGGDFKPKTSGKPEAVVIAVDFFDAIAVRGAKVFEFSVLERMIEVVALVIGSVVAIAMIIADVLEGVGLSVDVLLDLGFCFRIVALDWRRGTWPWLARGLVSPCGASPGGAPGC